MDGDRKRKLLTLTVAGILAGAAVLALLRLTAVPEGPRAIAWDREPCAHCRMHIGDPRFAAQLQTTDGRVLSFDDPGCLIRYQSERPVEARAVYFHHYREDRWLGEADVSFAPAESTPMGYGFGATDRGSNGALSYADARSRILTAASQGGGPEEGQQ